MKKILYIAIVLAVLAVFVIAIRRIKKPGVSADTSGFKDLLYQWIWKKAGGLSVSTAGGDADADGAPITVTIDGEVFKNPHTNRDVQWNTYKAVAPELGLSATPEAFVRMTFSQWKKIVDHIVFGNGFEYTNNPVLAAYVGSWYWGSGSISSSNIEKIKSILASGGDNKYKLRNLVDLRKKHFKNLRANNPAKYSEALVNSWCDRAESFFSNFSKFV